MYQIVLGFLNLSLLFGVYCAVSVARAGSEAVPSLLMGSGRRDLVPQVQSPSLWDWVQKLLGYDPRTNHP